MKTKTFFFLNQSSIYRRNHIIKKKLNGKNKRKWLRDLSYNFFKVTQFTSSFVTLL